MAKGIGGGQIKGGKKNRKFNHNRNKPANKRYLAESRWEKNKKRRVSRHLRRFPGDRQAARVLGHI